MRTLKMIWNKENGRLICHWIDFVRQPGQLCLADMPRSVGPGTDAGIWQMPTSPAEKISSFRH
jgi:hypothetical protein